MYSDRGKATVTGVVETVVALPCRVMGAVASVTSGEVLLTRWSGVRRPGVRGPEGSGEPELASEAPRGRASRNWRPRPRGVGRVGTCVRGSEGSGESELASEAPRGRASRNLRPRP